MTEKPIELHNIYTLYELNEDGSEAEDKLLSFGFRPQDWGDPRWHLHYCKIEISLSEQIYINHCYVWQEVERNSVEAFQAISSSLFLMGIPGRVPELCGKTHLSEDDFWCDEWGQMPPFYTEFVCFAGHEDCPIADDGVGQWSSKHKGYLCPRCNCFTSELEKSPDELDEDDE